MKKNFLKPVFALFALVLLSSAAVAVIIGFPAWLDGSTTMTINKGDTAFFRTTLTSANKPITYNVYLYNPAFGTTKQIYSGLTNSDDTWQFSVTPSDYDNIGGNYTVIITATDALQSKLDNTLKLNVIDSSPVLFTVPGVTVAKNSVHMLDLNSYVSDSDDLLTDLTWTIAGNTLATVTITNGVAMFTAGNTTGSEALNVTVCDTSLQCSTGSFILTVVDSISSGSSRTVSEINVKDVRIQAFGDQMLIRNHGVQMQNVKLKVEIEAQDAPLSTYNLDLGPNTVKYLTLNTEGVPSGDYLARVTATADDSSAREYVIVSV